MEKEQLTLKQIQALRASVFYGYTGIADIDIADTLIAEHTALKEENQKLREREARLVAVLKEASGVLFVTGCLSCIPPSQGEQIIDAMKSIDSVLSDVNHKVKPQ